MIKITANNYPWIGALAGGIIGLLLAILVSYYLNYFPYSLGGIDWGGVFWLGSKIGFFVIGLIGSIFFLQESIPRVRDVFFFFVISGIGGIIIGGIIALIIVAALPVFFGILLGASAGFLIGIAVDLIKNNEVVFEDYIGNLVIGGIVGMVLSAASWLYGDEFLINVLLIPITAAAGLVAGEFFERREEERLEYERQLRERKAKIEQWQMKYIVSNDLNSNACATYTLSTAYLNSALIDYLG